MNTMSPLNNLDEGSKSLKWNKMAWNCLSITHPRLTQIGVPCSMLQQLTDVNPGGRSVKLGST